MRHVEANGGGENVGAQTVDFHLVGAAVCAVVKAAGTAVGTLVDLQDGKEGDGVRRNSVSMAAMGLYGERRRVGVGRENGGMVVFVCCYSEKVVGVFLHRLVQIT